MDQLLYTVRWDNGQTSKHYGKELFCIGRFQSRTEFEQAIKPIGDVELIVGPAGGIKSARFQINYDGQLQTAEVDRRLWLECIEPIAQSRGLTITKTKLQNH
ncbi:MAG TPA: hypothetical protein VMB85_01125 [Bryobacteraceae bacterium]|nr:hypothetical protein [Bryobacteraceae bacterium]